MKRSLARVLQLVTEARPNEPKDAKTALSVSMAAPGVVVVSYEDAAKGRFGFASVPVLIDDGTKPH